MLVGKLGEGHMTTDEGYAASRMVALNLISTLQQELGDLESVVKVVKLFGIVNSAEGFVEQHLVGEARPVSQPAARLSIPFR